ncbi:MAG: tRNA (5-methylaminomethyl-2-thiouridine)(34)-methyltransferase MnmD [Cyanophyceae cyanobacterium]
MAAPFHPVPTADGSFTFFSAEFDEAFHSYSGARLESQQKFVGPCHVARKAQSSSLTILDVCYGLGYNSAVALATIWAINPSCRVELTGLEADPTVPLHATEHQLLAAALDEARYSPIVNLLETLSQFHQVQTKRVQAQLLIGDARKTIQQYAVGKADVVFLDPFSPPKCPQLWTVEFLGLVAQRLAPEGRLATYSCAAAVRTALKSAGLTFGPTQGTGRQSPGTVASFSRESISELSPQEREHLNTRAAVPYRDPRLQDAAEIIVQRRQQEQQQSRLEPTSHWKKRWMNRNFQR